jgi:hypothetical protein
MPIANIAHKVVAGSLIAMTVYGTYFVASGTRTLAARKAAGTHGYEKTTDRERK